MLDFNSIALSYLTEAGVPTSSWFYPVIKQHINLFNTTDLNNDVLLNNLFWLSTKGYITSEELQPYEKYVHVIDFIANTDFSKGKPKTFEEFLKNYGDATNVNRADQTLSLTKYNWSVTNRFVLGALTGYDKRAEINAEPYKNLPPLAAIIKLLTDQKGYDVKLAQQIIQYPLSVNKNFTKNKYAMTSIYNIALDLLLFFRKSVIDNNEYYLNMKELGLKDVNELEKCLEQFAGNEKANTPAGMFFKQLYVNFVNGK